MKINAFDGTGKSLSPWELDVKPLGKASPLLLAQALRVYEWNLHQKTHKTKSRGEVQGSTRKIYRQKGTGRARHGARYAPLFVGGGVAHGPRGVRPNNLILPSAMRRRALATAFLDKLSGGQVVGLSSPSLAGSTTASGASLMAKLAGHPKNKVTIVTNGKTTKLYQSIKNLQGVTTKRAALVSAYDLVSASMVIITKTALENLTARIIVKK